jgi:hypothetical protein
MADWKQITARIRRARSGKDPVAQLSGLFEKTRDAMVAFELARFLETSGQNSDAAKWYVTAAERFRRADWKGKAQEAAVRLGADLSAASAGDSAAESTPQVASHTESSSGVSSASENGNAAANDSGAESEAEAQPEEASAKTASQSAETGDKKRRRRGRRGGRNRRKGEARKDSSSAPAGRATANSSATEAASPGAAESAEPEFPRTTHRRAIPTLPVETVDAGGPSLRGRSGDPGLSSRLSVLEMQLRRLLTCPPAKLDEADHAPAGPGVLVLTDSDLTSYYYVEACQTLRVAVGNLLRGGATRRGVESMKPRLAEHLGIAEARVSKYLADHCVVRWLQLDEGASHFAHFVVAVIRPVLNE